MEWAWKYLFLTYQQPEFLSKILCRYSDRNLAKGCTSPSVSRIFHHFFVMLLHNDFFYIWCIRLNDIPCSHIVDHSNHFTLWQHPFFPCLQQGNSFVIHFFWQILWYLMLMWLIWSHSLTPFIIGGIVLLWLISYSILSVNMWPAFMLNQLPVTWYL